jgi:hypothetical protein
MVIDDWRFPRRRRGEAGGDGDFGGRRRARKTTRKSGESYQSTLQREGRRRGSSRGEGEASPRGYQRKSEADCMVSGEEFQQPGGQYREEEGKRKERGARGFIGEALMANYLRKIKGGRYSGGRFRNSEWGRNLWKEEDGSEERVPLGGEREEGERGLGWLGGELGRLATVCGPSGLLALPFYFFFLFSFSFVSEICFGF